MERVQASAKYTDSGWCGAGVEFCMGRADAGRYPITSKYVNAREPSEQGVSVSSREPI